MSALCLVGGAIAARVAVTSFTLAWMHSIEKIRWEEDWRIEGPELVLVEGRIRGSGAGMEPPPGAVLDRGVWRFPGKLRVPGLALTHSPYTPGYELCVAGECRALADRLPGLPETATIEATACP